MAITVKHPNGKADSTSVTPTGTQSLHLIGAPASGNPFTQGIYIKQVDGASGTYRWLEDRKTPGTASPAAGTWTYAGF